MSAWSLRRLTTAQQAMLAALPHLPPCQHATYPNGTPRCDCDSLRRRRLLGAFLAVQDAGWSLQPKKRAR